MRTNKCGLWYSNKRSKVRFEKWNIFEDVLYCIFFGLENSMKHIFWVHVCSHNLKSGGARFSNARAYVHMLANTHTHTHLIKALGSEGSADIVVPRSLQSPKCQGTYRSIRDNVFLRNMSWPWLTYLRKYSSCAKTDRVSLPVLYSWQHGRSRYGKLAFLLSCV